MVTSSAGDREFEPRSGQSTEYKIGMCCFSAKHAALMSKNKDWLARNQNNVSEWSDMSVVSVSKNKDWLARNQNNVSEWGDMSVVLVS